MTWDELSKGAKAMADYYGQVNGGPLWNDLAEDSRNLWRDMFSIGIKAVAHG